MRISDVAANAGVNLQTLRYYERRGLLPDPRARHSRYRDYDTTAVARVRFIKEAQELGFSLNEVSELIALREHRRNGRQSIRALAAAKVAQIQERLDRLTVIKRDLENLIHACQTSEADCPILEAIEAGPSDNASMESVPTCCSRVS